MRIGVLARADARGLGRQSYEWFRHLGGSALVVLNRASALQGFDQHPEWYGESPSVQVNTRDWTLPEAPCRAWLETVDVVYAPETLYDWRFADWARDAGARTVVHVNPEFWRERSPMPDALWNPTSWRLPLLPAGTTVVPVPVAAEDYEPQTLNLDSRLRVLHVAGHVAAGDRAGTLLVGEASRHLPSVEFVVRTQDQTVPGITRRYRWRVETGGLEDHRSLFDGFDVLLHPRRYGGLSLVTQEALAAGLAVVMPDTSPNPDWPIIPVRVRRRGYIRTAAGRLETAEVSAGDLANVIQNLATDRTVLGVHQANARTWAEEHSWTALTPTILAELERVVG